MRQFAHLHSLIARLLIGLTFVAAISTQLLGQDTVQIQAPQPLTWAKWLIFLELPFWGAMLYYAYRTVAVLKGGVFSKGMKLLAFGLSLMALGHFAMQLNHHYQYDVWRENLSEPLSTVVWFLTFLVAWLLIGRGFFKIYTLGNKK